MRSMGHLAVVLVTLACGSVDKPLSSDSQAVELNETSMFGFELQLPTDLLEDGWQVRTVVPPDGQWDRFRSLKFFRRFALVVGAPRPESEGSGPVVGISYMNWSIGTSSFDLEGAEAGASDRVFEIRVYQDIPHLTFSGIADTLRHISFDVLDWDLNGLHIKEIDVDNQRVPPWMYGHTNANVPRVLARATGYIYAIFYEGSLRHGDASCRASG